MTRVWPTRAALVAALAVLLGALLPAAPASAVAVTPTEKSFSASIDSYPIWVRENGCSPTEKPGPRYLRRLLRSTYGDLGSNIVRPCTAADSGHEEGRALDWMTNARVPEQREMAEAFIAWLQAPDGFGNPEAMARRLGIAYVIWNNYTWRAYDPARGWTEYNRCDHPKKHKKRYDNYCHRTHVHISFTWDGALRRTSYYSGFVSCPAPLPVVVPPVPAPVPGTPVPAEPVVTVPPALGPVTPLTPARILNTRTGLGMVSGPCRVHPDVRLDLAVLGVGGVPAAGVSAVVLRVELRHPDADLHELRVWPAGSAMPVEVTPLDPETGTVAVVTVPVGAGGQVSLQLAGAMAHVRVGVLGYVAAPVV